VRRLNDVFSAHCLQLTTHSHMSEFYHPECARGVRWDDPAFGIEWPELGKRTISEKDQSYSDFVP